MQKRQRTISATATIKVDKMNLTKKAMLQAYAKSHVAYVARCEAKNETPNVKLAPDALALAMGMVAGVSLNPDVMKGASEVYAMPDDVFATLQGFDLGKAFLTFLRDARCKVAMSLPGLATFITRATASGDASNLMRDGGARTFVRAIGAILLCDAKTKEGVAFAVSRINATENVSDSINMGKVRENLGRMGLTGKTSFSTQYSQMVGSKNSMGVLLGVTVAPNRATDLPAINAESPVTIAILRAIAATTQSSADAIGAKSQGGEAS